MMLVELFFGEFYTGSVHGFDPGYGEPENFTPLN